MQIFAFILALIAMICFLGAAYFGGGATTTGPAPARRWHLGWLGLAFLTISWMVQLIWVSGNHISVN